ncbi:PREDICTED: ataxin-2 homolog [Drosophila arizonae]|uniref:Ataxin-2 homolog n=1 Tax=Drosophila arizonae TaxID=7263 RepID=A0ABM1Q556_DROAR|nr:PREDICTED: ataxin-2 homolog [Drosophila arizonae]
MELPMSELPLGTPLRQQHGQSNYHEAGAEAPPGLAGYGTSARHYYGAASAAGFGDGDGQGDLAPTPYANYERKAISGLAGIAHGFVPHSYSYSNNNNNNNGMQSGYSDRGKIDFVINAANYELTANEEQHQQQQQQQLQPDIYYQSYAYQPRASQPNNDYHIEQFSNYRHPASSREQQRQQQQQQQQHQQITNANALAYANRQLPMKRKQLQQEEPSPSATPSSSQLHHEDQQLLYSQAEQHIVDMPHPNALPPITTTVHHTPSSSRAIAGLPLSKHIEVTKHVPITHYQQIHVPYKQPLQLRIPRPVITAIPKPIPIRIPVTKAVAVPQLQEVKIPVEKVRPVPVERPVPYVVERQVPYRVEKPIATPVFYPYPVKVPVIRTVVHKQRPQYTIAAQPLTPLAGWQSPNHLLG